MYMKGLLGCKEGTVGCHEGAEVCQKGTVGCQKVTVVSGGGKFTLKLHLSHLNDLETHI